MRGDVHAMTVRILNSIHGHRDFVPKGQRTYLLLDIHPILWGQVSPDLNEAGFELIETRRLDPEEAVALRNAYKAMGRTSDVVSLADVHDDLKAIVEEMEDTAHPDIDLQRRRLRTVLGYYDDCGIVRPGCEDDE